MKIIQQQPNPSGAYPPIQEGGFSTVPAGMALWPEDLPTEPFYTARGFVQLTVEDVAGVPTVTACAPDAAALETWQAAQPPEEPAPPSEAEQLRADVDYIAAMTGVIL